MIEELYVEVETLLLNNIAKKIGQNKKLFQIVEQDNTKITDWQLDRLKELDGLTKENIEIIAKQTKKTPQEIEKLFKEAINELPDEKLIQAGVKIGVLNAIPPISQSQLVKNALTVAINSTKTTFNKVNNSLLASSRASYVTTVNKVSTNVIAGVMTPQQAMTSAVKEMTQQGLTAFTANNGAQWSPEAYTSMVIKSNVKNTTNDIQDIRIQEAGGNYIEINSYSGARPLCSLDQGQVFSLNGDTTPIVDINGRVIPVRSWYESTHGQPAGILGINCGHDKFMFVPELSAYNRQPINRKENDEAYEEKQQQRYLERQIRNAKREVSTLESAGLDATKEKQKVKDKQAQMREFINSSGRTRDYGREKIV
jgi:hypothetical protein